uniref:Uncharacterized protein n=1 Tax=Strongyloides papillosus TaxID=174720 RepID=A0A0N5BI87_STREA
MAQQLAPQFAADLSAILGYLIAFFIINLLINLSKLVLLPELNRPFGVPNPPPHGYFPTGVEAGSQYPVLTPRYPASVVPSYEQSVKDDVTCLPA